MLARAVVVSIIVRSLPRQSPCARCSSAYVPQYQREKADPLQSGDRRRCRLMKQTKFRLDLPASRTAVLLDVLQDLMFALSFFCGSKLLKAVLRFLVALNF
jgi:hypothetical protein